MSSFKVVFLKEGEGLSPGLKAWLLTVLGGAAFLFSIKFNFIYLVPNHNDSHPKGFMLR